MFFYNFTFIRYILPIFKPITFLCYYIYFSLLSYDIRFTQLHSTLLSFLGHDTTAEKK